MASSTPAGPALAPEEGPSAAQLEQPQDRKGKGKALLTRMKTILKKADPTKRLSLTLKGGPSGASDIASALSPVDKGKAPEMARHIATPVGATKIPRHELFEQRAKLLAERYGLKLEATEWYMVPGAPPAVRVEKNIKMRVHRKCHICNTHYGHAKECGKCGHMRCKQCPRIPPKRTEGEREEARKRRAAVLREQKENAPIVADWSFWQSDRKVVLRRPAKTNAQDLIYRKPRQRVRRHCCQCGKLYHAGTKTCGHCQHMRCTDCPRDPAKSAKYPYGYPGDAPGTKSAFFECHVCMAIFPSLPKEQTDCSHCGHTKCYTCKRVAPRKVEPQVDPVLWEALQAKLEALNIG